MPDDDFSRLTTAERDFADQVFMALVRNNPNFSTRSVDDAWSTAFYAARERTRLQALRWSNPNGDDFYWESG